MKKGKNILKSKTFWVNLLSIAGLIVQSQTGYIIDPATQAMGLGLINGILRSVTKEPISL